MPTLGATDKMSSPITRVLHDLHLAALGKNGAGLSDGQLLEHFLVRGDEIAFAVLVRRHGPMVLGVCRRLLGNVHDAEDAFQAAFLVLARKAASIRPRELVGNWLHGVAYRTALKAKTIAARRQSREKQLMDMPHPTVEPDELLPDWRPLLDQELHRLPDKFRVPILLCDLEGQTRREAARRLRVPDGTLSNRLAAGRRMLARRLASRGVGLSVGGMIALLGPYSGAAVPASLEGATLKAIAVRNVGAAMISGQVAVLTKGVLQAMWFTKIKIATLVMVMALGLIGTGTRLFLHPALAEKPADKPATPKEDFQKDITEVTGVVKSIDAAKNTLTIVLGNKKLSGAQTYTLAGDAKVLLDSGTQDKLGAREGKLADLTDGLSVTLKLSSDQKVVVSIWAEGPTVQGILKAVDVDNNTLRIETIPRMKGESAHDKTFPVAKNAKVGIDHGQVEDKSKPSQDDKLRDLAHHLNVAVFLKLSADRKVVGSIWAEGPTMTGVLKGVDAAKDTITVTVIVPKGEPEVNKTFTVAKNARISIDDGKGKDKSKPQKENPLTALPAGAIVELRLSLDQQSVLAIGAKGKNFMGLLKAVDAVKNTVSVWDKASGDKTFALAPDVAVFLDGKNEARKVSDVPVPANVNLKLLADQKTVQEIWACGPTVQGVVKGNAGNGFITVANKMGENTFPVPDDAPIRIEGQREGRLSDLIEGTVASVKQSVDKSAVLEIHAEGPSFHGVVKQVDSGNNTITVTIGFKNGEDKTFSLTKETAVATALYGVPLTLSDLKAEKEINLRLSIDQKTVARITVLGK